MEHSNENGLNVKRSAHAMSMCDWHHVTCDIHLKGDLRKYIIAIIQSKCMISTGGITICLSVKHYLTISQSVTWSKLLYSPKYKTCKLFKITQA